MRYDSTSAGMGRSQPRSTCRSPAVACTPVGVSGSVGSERTQRSSSRYTVRCTFMVPAGVCAKNVLFMTDRLALPGPALIGASGMTRRVQTPAGSPAGL